MNSTFIKLLNYSSLLIFALSSSLKAQGWKPAMEGLGTVQIGSAGSAFDVKFKANGPLGKDWIYGGFWTPDSLRRCVAYRAGGQWVALPFSGYKGNFAKDIEMYGDTLYILGNFGDVVIDNRSDTLPNTGLLKWFNDSLWIGDQKIFGASDMAVKGDTLLFAGTGSYYDPPNQIIYNHFMTQDRGKTWQYPYSIVHPTDTAPNFGSTYKLEILPNGDILTLNNGSPIGNPFRGISRWDGNQWHSYGNGLFGPGYVHALDFDFYKGDIVMAGSFAKYYTFYGDTTNIVPSNPGNSIVRWDGNEWQQLATGVLEGGVSDIFTDDSILYCSTFAGHEDFHLFGDAYIPYFAGWDGHQWCGTPFESGYAPVRFGIIKDTLYVLFYAPTTMDGMPVSYLNYYDGDYLHGPDAICSTYGLGEKEKPLLKDAFTLYPNPVGDILKIESSGKMEKLKIINMNGQCVLEYSPKDVGNSHQINISALSPAFYIVEINGQYHERLIKL